MQRQCTNVVVNGYAYIKDFFTAPPKKKKTEKDKPKKKGKGKSDNESKS